MLTGNLMDSSLDESFCNHSSVDLDISLAVAFRTGTKPTVISLVNPVLSIDQAATEPIQRILLSTGINNAKLHCVILLASAIESASTYHGASQPENRLMKCNHQHIAVFEGY